MVPPVEADERHMRDADPALDLDDLRLRLAAARSVCVLTGSGISAESGLPTFRGIGGLWRTHRVEQLASPQGFARDPRLVWTWYNERRTAHKGVEPSPARRAELMLVVGTSGIVQPAASLATKRCTRAYVVEVNPEETALTPHADRSIRARASDVLPQLAR